jgi:hypothetical protein
MGVTSSKQKVENFQENLVSSLSESTQTISQTTEATLDVSQAMTLKNFSACGGDINIGTISQTVAGQFNFSQMASPDAVLDFQAAMKNALDALVEKDTTVKNELGGVGVTTDEQYNTNVNNNITNMVSKINQSSMSAIMNTMNANQTLQVIDFSTVCGPGLFGIGGSINIGAIDQTIQLDLVTAQVASLVTSVYQEIVQDNEAAIEAGASLYVDNSGFASILSAWFQGVTGIVVTIIIVFALLIAVIVVPIVVLKRRRKRTAAQAQLAQVQAATASAASAASAAPAKESFSSSDLVGKASDSAQKLLNSETGKKFIGKATGYLGKLFK